MRNVPGSPPTDRLILTNAGVVTPSATFEAASLVIEGERIAEVCESSFPPHTRAREQVIDVRGKLVMPGIVCLHNDAIEKAIDPRPNTRFPEPFALTVLDRALSSAGVTTQFHAVAFESYLAKQRNAEKGLRLSRAVRDFAGSGRGLVDHRILFRCAVRQLESLDAILTCAEEGKHLVSMDDHAHGQGQMLDLEKSWEQMIPYLPKGTTKEEWLADCERVVNETDEVRERVCARLATEARGGRFILVAHDDNSAEQVDRGHSLGCVMSEFAVTLEAARRAREIGMSVGMGAPNVVRGGSLNGNAGAADLARRGLLDVLLADYDAPSLLYAALLLARERLVSLEGAVRLITRNPARVAELADRGSLEPGLRGDVIVVHAADQVPVVTDYIVAGVPRFSLHHAGV